MKKYDALTIPTVKWINDPKRNPKRYVAASLFSGGGFSSLGLKLAGFDVRYACEFIESARKTYMANATPDVVLDGRDVREVSGKDILKACRVKRGELDYLDMSPPCRLFSNAAMGSNRAKGAGAVVKYDDKEQRLDDLFTHGARLLREIKPRVFHAENVAAMANKTNVPYFLAAMKELQDAGYCVAAAVLDASRLGVPQVRKRLIFVGVRNDLNMEPVFPKAQPVGKTLGVSDVLPNITRLAISSTSPEGLHTKDRVLWRDACMPCPTLTCTWCSDVCRLATAILVSGFIRTKDGITRHLTPDEGKLITGVPSDFALIGAEKARWARLGDAHVPLQVYAIAATLAEKVLSKI